MKRALKVCMKAGCNELTSDRYCEKHIVEAAREVNRRYDKYNRNQQAKAFYSSKEWFKARSKRMKQDFGLCVKCKEAGRLVKADVVHHKEELMKAWDKRIENDNLESLCHSCHNEIHKKG